MNKPYLTSIEIINLNDGDVLHALKAHEESFKKFGEAYFSVVRRGKIKAWKMHQKMTLNIIVPVGEIRFVLFEDCENFTSQIDFQEFYLSRSNYNRLTVPPNYWMGFQCISNEDAMLLNIADIEHDSNEILKKDLQEISYDWQT